jgi:5-formyltetrahydrofolate cyclo-ligase
MNKPAVRRAMQALLEKMGPKELADRSAKVADRLQQTGAWRWMDTLLAFLSMPHEIQTGDVIRAAHGGGKAVAVPRIEGADVRFLVMPPGSAVPPRDRWGIPVPDPSWPGLDLARAGKILVAAPGLAFDRSGNRLGRGKGYYDRFLSGARAAGAPLVVIGICFSDQLLADVPRTASDEAVDGVVTDTETLLFDRAGLIH